MQAIRTKYLCPTDTKGSRISASADAGRKIYHWRHELNPEQNHARAASQFAADKRWTGKLASGQLPDGSWAHVFVD